MTLVIFETTSPMETTLASPAARWGGPLSMCLCGCPKGICLKGSRLWEIPGAARESWHEIIREQSETQHACHV